VTERRQPTVPRDDEYIAVFVGTAGALTLAAVLVPLRDDLRDTNVALILLVPVLVSAVIGGRWSASASALVAALTYNFFFTEPYLSLRIDDVNDVETFLILLVVALLAAEVGLRARRHREQNRTAHVELAALQRVTATAAVDASTDQVVRAACDELVALFGLESCAYDPARSPADSTRLSLSGGIVGSKLVYRDGGFDLPDGELVIPVAGRGHDYGALVLNPRPATRSTREQRLVAVTIADTLGLVCAADAKHGDRTDPTTRDTP
jgi:Domain of unknown function (DUF4118)